MPNIIAGTCCCTPSTSCVYPDTLYGSVSAGCECFNGALIAITTDHDPITPTWVNSSGGPCDCDGAVLSIKCDHGVWQGACCSGPGEFGTVISTSPLMIVFEFPDVQACGTNATITITE